MERTYVLTVFNTVTGEYEKVSVSKEVYHAYMRTGWNIKDNNKRFYAREIQLSSSINGGSASHENYKEFVDNSNDPETLYEKKEQIDALYTAIAELNESDRHLVRALFFAGQTEREYADHIGVYRNAVHKRKVRILKQLKKSL